MLYFFGKWLIYIYLSEWRLLQFSLPTSSVLSRLKRMPDPFLSMLTFLPVEPGRFVVLICITIYILLFSIIDINASSSGRLFIKKRYKE